ncbi:MAG: S9 family peptidase [Ferruginibacter sp.]
MRTAKTLLGITAFSLIYICSKGQIPMKRNTYQWPASVTVPSAEKKAKELKVHDDVRIDNYYWMNDFFKKGPDSTNAVNYLNAENIYYQTMMAGTDAFQEKLYTEMKARIKEKDESVPVFKNGYFYYSRQVEGKDYYIYCRKKENREAKEEVLLDVNAMAEGHNYFAANGFAISLDNKMMAYGVDLLSRRQYKIYIKDLETGETYKDIIPDTEGDPVWANDNKTIFYTAKNPVTLLSEKIKKHTLGAEVTEDAVVYEEKDPTNYINIAKTKSDKYILITSQATLSSEVRFIDANKPADAFAVFQPRIKDVIYQVDHAGSIFYIRTNKDAKNFKIMTSGEDKTISANWKEMIAHNDKVLIQGFELFKSFLAVAERKNGLTQIHIVDLKNNSSHDLTFDEAVYTASIAGNPEYNSETLRFNYTSLTTPASVYDYNMNSKQKVLMKRQEIPGKFNAGDYATERLFATATDGTKIPMSVVYRKGVKKDGNAPLLLYGYGSYGASMDASFSSVRLSLLDRGFIFVIANIRGGQEMGRYWYEDGKMMKKKNTFTDFIDCALYLIKAKYTSKEHLYANGGSAGGLLMGAVVNMRPDLWHGIIAAVPFVDVVTTMSDASIPLTTNEYDEWGNPANKESYYYMKSYSPYDNVEKKDYPNMLITTGLHDSQVQYFEPAKWVAKLREMKTDNNKLLLYTNMEAGHGGASGRFKALKDKAREYAFLFALEGIDE